MLRRLVNLVPDPDATALVRFHFFSMVFWTALVPPTLLWWNQSITWLALMSIYAIIVSHFACWDAARAEKKQDEA